MRAIAPARTRHCPRRSWQRPRSRSSAWPTFRPSWRRRPASCLQRPSRSSATSSTISAPARSRWDPRSTGSRDFKSGYRWPQDLYLDVQVTRLDDASDAKVPWELSRGHQLLTLARAARLTGRGALRDGARGSARRVAGEQPPGARDQLGEPDGDRPASGELAVGLGDARAGAAARAPPAPAPGPLPAAARAPHRRESRRLSHAAQQPLPRRPARPLRARRLRARGSRGEALASLRVQSSSNGRSCARSTPTVSDSKHRCPITGSCSRCSFSRGTWHRCRAGRCRLASVGDSSGCSRSHERCGTPTVACPFRGPGQRPRAA